MQEPTGFDVELDAETYERYTQLAALEGKTLEEVGAELMARWYERERRPRGGLRTISTTRDGE